MQEELSLFGDDATTTVEQLRDLMRQFVQERNWQQFHRPKNLAMSISIEAAELMEHFQWVTNDQSERLAQQPEERTRIGEEIADVLSYLLAMANALQIDLTEVLVDKMRKNALKYPKDEYFGRYGPTDTD